MITGNSDLIINNAYCQYSLPLEGFLDKIERILSNFQSEKVLITMDSNARSELWFDKVTDGKGILLEEFIYEQDLTILNKPNTPPTFMSGSWESNIDITLATKNFLRYVKAWKVDCSCKTSDHNMIIMELEGNGKIGRNWIADLGFNIKKADWQIFYGSVEKNFDEDTIKLLSTLPAKCSEDV